MKHDPANAAIIEYVATHSMPPGPVHRWIVSETARRFPDATQMQIEADQGPLLALLVKLLVARQVLEIGTFTGLSSLWMAESLPADGRLVCCDVSEEYTSVAREAWQRAGVNDRIDLRLAPALDTLSELVRPGGVIVADNTLWYGRVIDDTDTSADTEGIRRFNELAAAAPELDVALLPMADGVSVMYRRQFS